MLGTDARWLHLSRAVVLWGFGPDQYSFDSVPDALLWLWDLVDWIAG